MLAGGKYRYAAKLGQSNRAGASVLAGWGGSKTAATTRG